MSNRYQIVNPNGVKVNVIVWDGETELDLPEGYTIEPDNGKPYSEDDFTTEEAPQTG